MKCCIKDCFEEGNIWVGGMFFCSMHIGRITEGIHMLDEKVID